MAHIYAVAAEQVGWALWAVPLLVGALPELALLVQRRGFGRRGIGFGRRRGSFGLFRIFRVLFVLLFTTVLGPILLVVLVAFLAYRFFAGRRAR